MNKLALIFAVVKWNLKPETITEATLFTEAGVAWPNAAAITIVYEDATKLEGETIRRERINLDDLFAVIGDVMLEPGLLHPLLKYLYVTKQLKDLDPDDGLSNVVSST